MKWIKVYDEVFGGFNAARFNEPELVSVRIKFLKDFGIKKRLNKSSSFHEWIRSISASTELDHPFYLLSENNNIIATCSNYNHQPNDFFLDSEKSRWRPCHPIWDLYCHTFYNVIPVSIYKKQKQIK